jgi:hypothetical protein
MISEEQFNVERLEETEDITWVPVARGEKSQASRRLFCVGGRQHSNVSLSIANQPNSFAVKEEFESFLATF